MNNNSQNPKWSIAYLGTFHPAVPTLEGLAKRGWINFLVMPNEGDPKNDELLRISKDYELDYSYSIKGLGDRDIDLVIAANYSKLVPASLLEKIPCLNTHWSPLPAYRGVHGTAWGLINGDNEFAVSFHWMEREFDTGDMIAQKSISISSEENISDLHVKLAELQAELVLEILDTYDRVEDFPRLAQDHSLATYVPQRRPEDGIINWEWTTERIWNLTRALPAPKYPGAFTTLKDEKLIIWKSSPSGSPAYYSTPGQVVRVIKGRGVWVKTGDDCLLVEDVQLGDGAPCPADTILKRGDKLGYNVQTELFHLRLRLSELDSGKN